MTRFVLIRHAASPWTPDDARPLSKHGEAGALALVNRLADTDIGHIFSSPYKRAVQTVLPLAASRELPIARAAELRECLFGELGAMSFEDASVLAWSDFDRSWPGGESPRQAQQRILEFVTTLALHGPARPVVLATHGTLLTLLLNAFDATVGYDFWRSLRHPDVFRLEFDAPGRGAFARI
jgi:2,3-bisphosphoglycerate-dependent phosphoglycerate mutase